MRKLVLIIVAGLVLSGCSSGLKSTEIEAAIKFCKGTANIHYVTYGNSAFTVRCSDYSSTYLSRF